MTRAEMVLDASVAAKCFFEENGSESARRLVDSGVRLVAPELIFTELASIAAKKVRRGEVDLEFGTLAMTRTRHLLEEVFSSEELALAAFSLAVETGCSAYDGLYLSLAEVRGCKVVTADERLVRRALASGLGHLVDPLQP